MTHCNSSEIIGSYIATYVYIYIYIYTYPVYEYEYKYFCGSF